MRRDHTPTALLPGIALLERRYFPGLLGRLASMRGSSR
jgi:hypothetical protein